VDREPGLNHGVMGVQNDHRGLSSFFRLFMGSEHSAARCDRNCRTSGALESYLGGLGGLKLAVLQSQWFTKLDIIQYEFIIGPEFL